MNPFRTAGLFAALVSAMLAVPASLVGAGPATPPPLPLLFGNESAAYPDGPAALLFNPAASGLRYPNEFALSFIDPLHGDEAWRGALAIGGFSIASSFERSRVPAFGFGFTGGGDCMRLGTVANWIAEREGGRTVDYRFGALSRPMPWLSLGGVVDHVTEPRISGISLGRDYTVALALRPLAFSRPRAHTWGTRLTLTGDLSLAENQRIRDGQYRIGAELEPLPGLALRGIYFPSSKGFQVGLSLLGVRAGYHGQSGYDRSGSRSYSTHSVSLHGGEDLSVLARRANRRVAVVRVGGNLADETLAGFSLGGATSTAPVAPLHRQLERALDDPLTRGVLLDLGGVSGMAQLEELKPRIARLRAAGKPVVAYMQEGGGRGDLYLASACDRVVTTPQAFYAGLGLRTERRYYRKLLADWGIRIDRSSFGKYKSAYRNFSVDSTPAPDRESIESALNHVQELFVSSVSTDRGIPSDRLLTVLDGRRWAPADLQKAGLIDSIGYREDAFRVLGRLAGLGNKPRSVRLGRLQQPARREWTVPTRIAVVYAAGAIETGSSGNDLLLGPFMGSETVSRQIERAFRNPSVEAVVLRVESPGGSSLGSDLIHHTIMRIKRETGKPLIVSMGGAAASGGYNISVPGDRIFSDRFTRTGSIGVLFIKPSLQGWYAKHHVHEDDFERGRYMRGLSPAKDWDAETQASADSAIFEEYRGFVSLVANSRKLSYDEVDRVAQGRVWLGEEALDRKLVDQIGGLEDAIAEAKRRARIPEAEKIQIAEYRRPPPGFAQRFLGSFVSDAWERSAHLPAPGETLFWMDDEEAP